MQRGLLRLFEAAFTRRLRLIVVCLQAAAVLLASKAVAVQVLRVLRFLFFLLRLIRRRLRCLSVMVVVLLLSGFEAGESPEECFLVFL